jgi:hypothetical protein
MGWIDMALDRGQWRALLNTIMNLCVPLNAGKFLSTCTTGCFTTRAQLHGVSINITNIHQGRRVHGCGGSIASL